MSTVKPKVETNPVKLTESSPFTALQHLRHSNSDNSSQKKFTDGPVYCIKFSPDGRYFASGGHDGLVKVWCLMNDPSALRMDFGHNSNGHQRSLTVGEQQLKSPGPTSPKPKHEAKKPLHSFSYLPVPLKTFQGHQMAIVDIEWSRQDYFLLSASLDGSVRLWHVSRMECLCIFEHEDVVTSVSFHPLDEKLFLSACFDGRIRLWSITEKKVLAWNEMVGQSFSAVAFNSDATCAIAGTMQGDCVFYELPDLKYDTQVTVVGQSKTVRGKSKIFNRITKIHSFTSDSIGEERIIVSSSDSRIRIFNLKDKSIFRTLRSHLCQNSFLQTQISDDGMLISPSEDKYIYFWKLEHELDPSFHTSPLPTNNKLGEMTRNAYYYRFFLEEVAHSAALAPLKIIKWEKDFKNTIESVNDDVKILVVGDITGRITIYQNDLKNDSFSSANNTIRSLKELFISNFRTSDSNLPNVPQQQTVGRSRSSTQKELVLPTPLSNATQKSPLGGPLGADATKSLSRSPSTQGKNELNIREWPNEKSHS